MEESQTTGSDDKNETTRFLGDGVSFKAKLIGILEVAEARGDRMCQEALADLKMAIRAAGEHKQRITVNVAIDGLRLRDEKTGDSLYHHPVHKISFIAQDMTDSRAFGYIFGSPDTGHRFFGIKTDKAASQVVIAMRDLFQVVFALKKQEIELAKKHLEKTYLPTSPLFSESSSSGNKHVASSHEKSHSDTKSGAAAPESKSTGTAVANLVDLELELSSLQQGLNQMERITPSDPFGSKDDPFGDSFISYPINKPILPPPPSSGRDRSSRTSDSSGAFSPRTPHGGAAGADVPPEPPLPSKDRKDLPFAGPRDERSGGGDWFAPVAAGRNGSFEGAPTTTDADERHEAAKKEIMSQFDVFTELDPLELKNPPKKALNDLANTSQAQEPPLFNTTFSQATGSTQSSAVYTNAPNVYGSDPFGEDPFVKEDPFANSDFTRQDPFDTEFAAFSGSAPLNSYDKKDLQALLQSGLSKSPKSSVLERQMSLNPSPKTVQFSKQNTFDDRKHGKLSQLHENPSLDISSESECAPEPPPRPAASLMQIKPPPLPPKKQNDFSVRPPPRPPHADDLHYEYMDHYETAPNSLELASKGSTEKNPPLPVPSRKSKFENDFTMPPERPKKQFNLQSSEEDYLTPISFPEKCTSPTVLLPPPQKSSKKQTQAAVASHAESRPNIATTAAADHLDTTLEGLDITLSQLTLSGLNDLANKLNIPPSQLNNMTLVQLTNYLSNFIKNSVQKGASEGERESNEDFEPDFAANFNNLNNSTNESAYDRYAVFRELQEEIKQTKIDTEPEQLQEETKITENIVNSNVNLNLKPINQDVVSAEDRYAALREIVEIELKQTKEEVNQNETEETVNEEDKDKELENINTVNKEKIEAPEKEILTKSCIIEYPDTDKEKLVTPVKSPTRQLIKSPVPSQVTDIIQNNTRLTSGSLSDVISGSSPEVDNTGSNSDVGKKTADATGESWAIFDHATVPPDPAGEKPGVAQSEEGVSPWSSDSKEFGDGSPPDWRQGSGSDRWSKEPGRTQEGWWDTSAEPEAPSYPPARRSTDSYDEESHEGRGDRPPRRRRQVGGGAAAGWQAGGGHSSSSRDVSPWEEERRPRRRGEGGWPPPRHPRGRSFERRRERTPREDSWDDEDEYEFPKADQERGKWKKLVRYDEEQDARFHWPDRHASAASRDHDWGEDWSEDRRHRRRRDGSRDLRDPREARERWCCPDWEQSEYDKSGRYPPGSRRPPPPPDRYGYGRDESPWEDEGADDPRKAYLTVRRGWRQRPSSASETDRRVQQMPDGKQRYYIGTGGSDGERDRRYKSGRRSRSRDSQCSEPLHRHKPESILQRSQHRQRTYPKPEVDKPLEPLEVVKKSSIVARKKAKDVGKTEEKAVPPFPKKVSSRAKSLFENDFVAEETRRLGKKFNFDEFETEPPTGKLLKGRQQSLPLHGSFKESKSSPRYSPKSKSLFEDDFSPSEKPDQPVEESIISSIKEETDRIEEEEEDSFGASNLENATNGRRKILAKNRLGRGRADANLKKSESINIFARENDPFDDDFFCGEEEEEEEKEKSPRGTELRWTEDFE